MPSHFEEIKNRAAWVRNIEIETVLQQSRAAVDKNDPAKWHTTLGVICVTGQKFFNWTKAVGGGGAIDLVMHLNNVDFIKAVCWLEDNISGNISHPCLRTPRQETI